MSQGVCSRRVLRHVLKISVFVGVISGAWAFVRAQTTQSSLTASPGKLSDGTTLLANGWRLSPVGRHLPIGTLPLNIALSLDGRYALVTNNGLGKPTLSMVDVAAWSVTSTTTLDAAWYGLVWSPDGTKAYVAGADQNSVMEFSYSNGTLARARTFSLPGQPGETFAGGLAMSPNGKTLFVTRVYSMSLSAIDVASGQVVKTVELPAEPYACVVSPDGRTVFVSVWGASLVLNYTTEGLRQVDSYQVGEHPAGLAIGADGRRLFVACANASAVWVIDTASGDAIEQISTALFPQAPPTSTPNALAISPDGNTLLIAVADINAVAVVDISNPVHSFVNGFIPAGYYPTGVAFTHDGKQILILNGKGLVPAANPLNANLDQRLLGDLQAVPTPDRTTLADDTRKVYGLTPYSDTARLAPPNAPVGSPIPRVVGGPTPIKHVFYVIRENRTYDQIFGDIPAGNGDPKLALFGKNVTPNAHAIAQNFVLFDNFYTDAEVSSDGHAFSTAAYATDFIQKTWQSLYAHRGGLYLTEGGGPMRNPFGNLSAPPGGYIWDYARAAGVSVRSYGEFVQNTSKTASGDVVAVETVPGLKGLVAPAFAGWDLSITDGKRIDRWLSEFHAFEASGQLPQLSIIRLPNDHTNGGLPGAPTPRAMIAENDVALGRLVEAISASPVYWRDSAIFVLEDDAQSGPDHVDSHRSVLLVAGPFARRGAVDHTFYTTSSVLRTIELILGLPPMSMYDGAATPLYNAFSGSPNTDAFHETAPGVPLDEHNSPSSYGATASLGMDFSSEDRAPAQLLNEIIWRSVKGSQSRMPPPIRSAFTRGSTSEDDVDDR